MTRRSDFRKMSKDSGFTLIELLVVIIIIGILAAIAIPVFLNQRQKGFDAAARSDARNVGTLEETYLVGNGAYVAAADAATATSLLGYRPSANVTSMVVNTDSLNEFCLKATSSTGRGFWYDNATGGISATIPTPVSAGLSCPA